VDGPIYLVFRPRTQRPSDVVRHTPCCYPTGWVLAVGVNPGKAPLFSADERMAMLKEICGPLAREAKVRARIRHVSGLVVEPRARPGRRC